MEKNSNLHPEKWTMKQLLHYCDENNIKYCLTDNKDQLIALILKDEIDKE